MIERWLQVRIECHLDLSLISYRDSCDPHDVQEYNKKIRTGHRRKAFFYQCVYRDYKFVVKCSHSLKAFIFQ